MTHPAADLEAQLRPEIDRLRGRADDLAAAVRERHHEALQALANGEEARAEQLLSEVNRLNQQCTRANRAWLKLIIRVRNAKQAGDIEIS